MSDSTTLLIEYFGEKNSTRSLEEQDIIAVASTLGSMNQMSVDYDLISQEYPDLSIQDPRPALTDMFTREFSTMNAIQKEDFRKQVILNWAFVKNTQDSCKLIIENRRLRKLFTHS